VERKKGERYSEEFRREVVRRMRSCDNILRLSREHGIHRRLLYNWRDRLDESNPAPLRSREFILHKEITKLNRLLANKMMEVDFFRRALQKVGARRRQSTASGAKGSLTK
jgi:transposase-like protein